MNESDRAGRSSECPIRCHADARAEWSFLHRLVAGVRGKRIGVPGSCALKHSVHARAIDADDGAHVTLIQAFDVAGYQSGTLSKVEDAKGDADRIIGAELGQSPIAWATPSRATFAPGVVERARAQPGRGSFGMSQLARSFGSIGEGLGRYSSGNRLVSQREQQRESV